MKTFSLLLTALILLIPFWLKAQNIFFEDDFETDKGWSIFEEIINDNPCYEDSIGEVVRSTEFSLSGSYSLRIWANKIGKPKNNHVLGRLKISESGLTGIYAYSLDAYIPASSDTGQTGPEFSVQNTKKVSGLNLTYIAGIQFVGNPYVNGGTNWRIWHNGEWSCFYENIVIKGNWYHFELVMDFEKNRYVNLSIKGAGIDTTINLCAYIIKGEERRFEPAVEITVEGENLDTCSKPRATQFKLYYDNVLFKNLINRPKMNIGKIIFTNNIGKIWLLDTDLGSINLKELPHKVKSNISYYNHKPYLWRRIKFSPCSNYITFKADTFGIELHKIIDLEGNIINKFDGAYKSENDFIWSTTGNSIIFVDKWYGGIYEYILKDSFSKAIVTSGFVYDHNPIVRPDNQKIAYVHHTYDSLYSICTVDRLGNNQDIICKGSGAHDDEHLDLDWIDNENLIFKVAHDKRVYYVNITDKKAKEYEIPLDFINMRVSPDKKKLAFYGKNLFFADINKLVTGTLDLKTTELQNVENFVWSPCGEYYALTQRGLGNLIIFSNEHQKLYEHKDSKYTHFDGIDWSVGMITSIDIDTKVISHPLEYGLKQNYPNPFNSSTMIEFSLVKTSFVELKIYNLSGQEVVTLINEKLSRGDYRTIWDGTDKFGNCVSSAIYLYTIKIGNYFKSHKMTFLK